MATEKTNGCGGFGTLSKVWKFITGKLPVFEACCDEHDLAYGQGGPKYWRLWADNLLRDCLIDKGHPALGWACWLAVRSCGWIFWKA